MSWDAWLETDCGGAENARLDELDWNLTFNVVPMLARAGLGTLRHLDGMPAGEAAARLSVVLDAMRADPDGYRSLEPENGWGDYETFLRSLAVLRDACHRQPDAVLRVR